MLARVATAPVLAVAIGVAAVLAILAWPHDEVEQGIPRLRKAPPGTQTAPRQPFPTPDLVELPPTPEEEADEGDRWNSRWLRECVDRGGRWCCGQGGCCGLRDTEIAPGLFSDLPMVSGPVATRDVEAILYTLGPPLKACRDHEWLEHTGFEYIFVRITLPAHGPAIVAIDGFDVDVANCMADVLTDAPFPRPASGTVTVRSSLSFR